MKKLLSILTIGVLIGVSFSCEDPVITPEWKDLISTSIYDYIIQNDTTTGEYGSFLKILEAAEIDKTISAYNPDGLGYTLFLPTNAAVDEFIEENDAYSSLDDLLNDKDFVSILARFHVVKRAIISFDFPFGAMPEYNMSNDFLTVTYVIGADSTTFKINNQAPVIQEDIEMSNGYIHITSKVLIPITSTSYEWLQNNPDYSIFTEAVEAAGLTDVLSRDIKSEENEEEVSAVTLLLVPDSIYNKKGIYNFDDLVTFLDPEDDNFTDDDNLVKIYTSYHILDTYSFLLDLENVATNYSTFTDIPVSINGLGLDLAINKGLQVYDTIVNNGDTTIVNYAGIYYDYSNILTTSGVIHVIDQVMEPKVPNRAIVTFEFRDEPLFREWREVPGEYPIEDSSALTVLSYSGEDMSYIRSGDSEHPTWSGDYILTEGDFIVKYKIPKIVQGSYNMFIHALGYGSGNAVIEVYVDGVKIGGVLDLSNINTWGWSGIEVGSIDFSIYEHHTVEIRSLIPGRLEWDNVSFEPI